MYYYNFTNDLRISSLDEILKEAAKAFLSDSVPSANEDKSKNNNYNTVGFYFNLKAKGNCAKIAANGNTAKVVLNFIRKFQFPNPRTSEEFINEKQANILLAPMREIVKLLFLLIMIDKSQSYLTQDEIEYFIFYNDNIAKRIKYNLIETAFQIITYRSNKTLPANINTNKDDHNWKQPDRQIREMIETLEYTGCVSQDDDNNIRLDVDNIPKDKQSDLFEILTYDKYWTGTEIEDYQRYMDEGLDYESSLDVDTTSQQETTQTEATKSAEQYEQIIYYGVPGSGKSFKIDNEKTKGAADVQKEKVVFHPDYTNSDFIGQIIPKMKEIEEDGQKKSIIEYSFKPGPFTTILRRALRDKNHQYYLLIEEINRGNAAAIFGDLFQLLDRDESGWSCSPVNNDDINFYVASEYEYWDENYSDSHPYDSANVNHPSGKQFSRNSGLQLPPNLSIYATMNTNDQNVFTLDNAFNRRFKPEYISNKEDNKISAHRTQYNLIIENTGIRWGAFRNVINKHIIASGLANAEDKQLGLFFIKAEKEITQKDFADKVLKYLWHDVFKRDKDVFNGANISKFEDLIDKFTGTNAFTDCFTADFVAEIKNGEINKDLTES